MKYVGGGIFAFICLMAITFMAAIVLIVILTLLYSAFAAL